MSVKRKMPTTLCITYKIHTKVWEPYNLIILLNDSAESLLNQIESYLIKEPYIHDAKLSTVGDSVDIEFSDFKIPPSIHIETEGYQIRVSFGIEYV